MINTRTSLNRWDALLVVLLLAVTTVYSVRFFAFSMHPKEDAAILMRYANHVAEGHGIVWNVGEAPVDGATDFLFMVLLAGLVKAGTSVEAAARGVGFGAHILTVVLVFLALRTLHRSNRWLALTASLFLALGPGLGYIAAYFGTPFFALFVAVTWWLAHLAATRPDSYRTGLAFALAALATGLIRPEGVLFTAFMLIAVVWMKGLRGSRRVWISYIVTFAVLGGAYFLWRYRYFGHPLPNPFYKKGGGHLYVESLRFAVRHTIQLCGPFLLAFVVGFRSAAMTRRTIFALIPTVGFVGMWILLSNEMNFLMRFQYALVPVVLISSCGLLTGLVDDWKLPRPASLDRRGAVVLYVLLAVVFAGVLHYQYRRYSHIPRYRDGRYDVAQMLREYRDLGYTLATTESGLLPLYSDWRVVDAWGLNDPWIARHGGVTESYLESQGPEIIVFHEFLSPIVAGVGHESWSQMVETLKAYAEKHGYALAASYGETPRDLHSYYVRPDFAGSGEIVTRIRRMDYFWHASGRKCTNYAAFVSDLPSRP